MAAAVGALALPGGSSVDGWTRSTSRTRVRRTSRDRRWRSVG
jgi:hypothetical protein